ncbi:MAG: hypothetical protein AAGD23_03845 [Pseudomonadota bacterium]
MSIEQVTAGEQVVVIFATAEADGSLRPAWLGCADDPDFRAARAACRGLGRCRAYVHTPDEPADAERIARDIAKGQSGS